MVGYGGKDLQKRKVLSLEWKSEGVMDDESGESMQPMEDKVLDKAPLNGCVCMYLISSHLLFFKNSCQSQRWVQSPYTYRYNQMLWRQIVYNNNDIDSVCETAV